MAKQMSALDMLFKETDRNNGRFTREELREANQKATNTDKQKPAVPDVKPALGLLVSVIEDGCRRKGGYPFICNSKELLLLLYKKSSSVYDEEIHSMLTGNHLKEFASLMGPHLKARNIDCCVWPPSTTTSGFFQFRNGPTALKKQSGSNTAGKIRQR